MSQLSLNAAATEVIGYYNDASKSLINAYNVGVKRVLGEVSSNYERALATIDLPMLSKEIKTNLTNTNQKVVSMLTSQLDAGSGRAVDALNKLAATSTVGLDTVSKSVAKIDLPVANTMRQPIEAISSQVAGVWIKLAEGVAAGAKKVEAQAASFKLTMPTMPAMSMPVPTTKAEGKTSRRSASVEA